MGFSWSLYFCQAIVVRQVLEAGADLDLLIRDRHNIAFLDNAKLAYAVYVDNVCVVSTDAEKALDFARLVHQRLESVGLKCHRAESRGLHLHRASVQSSDQSDPGEAYSRLGPIGPYVMLVVYRECPESSWRGFLGTSRGRLFFGERHFPSPTLVIGT